MTTKTDKQFLDGFLENVGEDYEPTPEELEIWSKEKDVEMTPKMIVTHLLAANLGIRPESVEKIQRKTISLYRWQLLWKVVVTILLCLAVVAVVTSFL